MIIAQLTDGVVTSVTQTNGIKTDANHIEVSKLDPTLLGCTYVDGMFVRPEVAVQEDPALWLIDVQPFMERFGASEFAIYKGTQDSAVIFNRSMERSKWVNLRSESLKAYMDALAKDGYITVEQKDAILSASVLPMENMALRKTYFGGAV